MNKLLKVLESGLLWLNVKNQIANFTKDCSKVSLRIKYWASTVLPTPYTLGYFIRNLAHQNTE